MIRENIRRWIKVQFQKEGIHRYPAALTDPNLEDVKHLGYEHLHYFYFYVSVEVFHNDRDLEFQQFRRWCESQFKEQVINIDYKSCEMLAEELIELINDKYPGRDIKVEVYEDNINGSILEFSIDRE